MIKKKDFVEIDYTGRLKENGIIFDTTDEKTAKENQIYNENMAYGSVVVCLGENQVVSGLDKALEGKEVGKNYSIELKAEDAFGKKEAKLIQLIPTNKFLKQKVQPVPGLQVNIDGAIGLVKTVSGGRTLVDFNHPLSGKDIVYDVNLKKLITDDKEKLTSYLRLALNIKDIDVKIENNKAKVELDLPKEAIAHLKEKVKSLIPSITDLDISKK